MSRKNLIKYLFIVAVFVIAAFAVADSLGVFIDKPYKAVPHGTHNHYVPFDRKEGVPIGDFPTEEPGPNEKITPEGQVVRKNQ
jgi:hypothetical protein